MNDQVLAKMMEYHCADLRRQAEADHLADSCRQASKARSWMHLAGSACRAAWSRLSGWAIRSIPQTEEASPAAAAFPGRVLPQ